MSLKIYSDIMLKNTLMFPTSPFTQSHPLT